MDEKSPADTNARSSKDRSKGGRKSSSKANDAGKRRRRRTSSGKEKAVDKGIPIFTDAFLDLYRKQKSDIRLLKLNYSQFSERFKLKDAQQEQLRLDNQKMRVDIEEISQRNASISTQLDRLEGEFRQVFNVESVNDDLFKSLRENLHRTDYQSDLRRICQTLQL